MKDEARLREALRLHLESAQAIADELTESLIAYQLERALDLLSAGDVDRLSGKPS